MKQTLVALTALLFVPGAVTSQQTAKSQGSHTVEFEVVTGLTGLGGSSSDLLLIVFSDRSADTPKVPLPPLFGLDVLAEFAFSGRDAPPGRTLRFKRYVADVSFLNARFIRLVNQGSDGWAGETLSMTVNGKAIFDRLSLYPRKGSQARGGIEKFNIAEWRDRNFWEADLQRIRMDRY